MGVPSLMMIAAIEGFAWNSAISTYLLRAITTIISDFMNYISNLMTPVNITTLLSNFMESTIKLLISFAEVLVLLAVIILLCLIARKIGQKEGGIVVVPFDTFSDNDGERHDGKAISALLTYELQKISHIHNQEIPEVPISIPRTTYSFKNLYKINSEARLLSGPVPKSETLEYSISEIGTVKTGILELSLGQLLTAFKRLLPGEYRHDIITGSLQKYGSHINIVANMEGDYIQAWKVSRKVIQGDMKSGDQIQFMVKDLAYQIAHQLARRQYGSKISAESWQAWKYYTEALEAYYRFALSKKSDDLNKAKKNCLLALKIEEDYDKPLELLSYLGYFFLNSRENIKVAQDIFNRIRQRRPNEGARGLGVWYLTNRKYKDALIYFRIATNANEKDSMSWFGKGMAHEELWNEEFISKKYEFCWDEIPGNDESKLKKFLSKPRRNIAWIKDGKIEKIENTIQASTEKNSLFLVLISGNEALMIVDDGRIDKLDVATERDKVYICKDKRVMPEPAAECAGGLSSVIVEAAQKVVDISPTAVGEVLVVAAEPWEAEAYESQRDAEDPPLYDPILFGDSNEKDELKDALIAFIKTIKIENSKNRKHFEAWYHKGLIHCKRGELIAAEKAFNEALTIEPKNTDVLYHSGVIHSRSNNHKKAIIAFDEVIKIYSINFGEDLKESQTHPFANLSWFYKGVSLSKLGVYDEAEYAYNKALESHQESALAWYWRGLNLGRLFNYQKALEAFNQTVQYKKGFPSAWFMKAFCHLVLNDYQDFKNAAEEALKLNNNNFVLQDIKGITLYILKNYEDCLIWFNQAVKDDPENAFTWNRKYFALKELVLEKDREEIRLFRSQSGTVLTKLLDLDKEAEEASTKADELGYTAPPPIIKVEFKNESIRAYQCPIVISIRQISENDLSRILIRSDKEIQMTLGYPVPFYEGYELTLKSTESDSCKWMLELSKDGAVSDSMILRDGAQSTYEYPNMNNRRMNDMRGLLRRTSNPSEQCFYQGRYFDIFEIGFSSQSRRPEYAVLPAQEARSDGANLVTDETIE